MPPLCKTDPNKAFVLQCIHLLYSGVKLFERIVSQHLLQVSYYKVD